MTGLLRPLEKPLKPRQQTSGLELWAGVECTLNRVQDSYSDQLERSGHDLRKEDLILIAGLGIRALRYPVLWERFAPEGDLASVDWSWADERLSMLRELGVSPIVGLVHHGSGPRHTSLADPEFATGLAEYASRVSERFPWVRDWTPVNEPVTTARFSGLYGHWYPHGDDERTFARMLVNQCRAVALSMQAIRRVNPHARLIQTDDLGRTYSTPRMAYQAEFENARRWLSWDLLCGRVDRHHRLWGHLLWAGIAEAELEAFAENPCPPDIIGINHYLTSERFLDDRLDLYPARLHGSNGRDRYADVEAVRVLPQEPNGVRGVLTETWERYGLPLAITEAHLGCTREEQMRWLFEVWSTAQDMRAEGTDIRAVTVWAVLGAYDWNSLLTRPVGHYEPGVFDIRGGVPRPTALAPMLRAMAKDETPRHPVLTAPGWWRRPQRLCYRSASALTTIPAASSPPPVFPPEASRPLLITGAAGRFGYAFARLCDHRGISSVALSREEMDITDLASVEAALEKYQPWAVINAAGCTDVDSAHRDEEHCYQVNTGGPAALAAICARQNIALLAFSSDQVFSGRQKTPYLESDQCSPVSIFGRSKVRAERMMQEIMPAALIVRPGPCFSPWDKHDFVAAALRSVSQREGFRALEDQTISPTYLPDLVHACLDLLIDGERGVWHLTNGDQMTWKQLAQQAAEAAGLDAGYILGSTGRSLGQIAARPVYTALGSERGQLLQPLSSALRCFLHDSGKDWRQAKSMEHEARTQTYHPLETTSASRRGRPIAQHRS